MTVEQTRATMDLYFETMGKAGDFSAYFSDDVTWLMVDTGQEVRGPAPVRDYILELHGKMFTQEQPHDLVITDHNAYIEGESVNAVAGSVRGLSYCLVYDLASSRITAMRCNGSIAALMSE
jgi:hypothetical protein